DVRVVLFVRLREGLTLDEPLIDKIKKHIRSNTTPRHVPAKVVQVTDIPRTKSGGKIVELAVRNVVHGEPVKNVEALGNPEALEQSRARAELKGCPAADEFPRRYRRARAGTMAGVPVARRRAARIYPLREVSRAAVQRRPGPAGRG